MKKLIATLTAIFISLIATPEEAVAGHHPIGHSYTYHSGYASCGSPIYTKRIIASYDRYHRPVYRYYRLPIRQSYRTTRYTNNNYYNRASSRVNYSRSNRYSGRR